MTSPAQSDARRTPRQDAVERPLRRAEEGTSFVGVLVAAWEAPTTKSEGARRWFATGRLDDGRSFALVRALPAASIWLPASLERLALERLGGIARALVVASERGWTSFEGAPRVRIELPHALLPRAVATLEAAAIGPLETEVPRVAEALAALGLRGPVLITGEATPGRRVDLVFSEPNLAPPPDDRRRLPALAWTSLALETDRDGSISAAALASMGPNAAASGPELHVQLHDTSAAWPAFAFGASCTTYDDERSLIEGVLAGLRRRDPDVLTGWEMAERELPLLAGRADALGVPFDLGRAAEPVRRSMRAQARRGPEIVGRAVIDATRLVRASGTRWDLPSLEELASELDGASPPSSSVDVATPEARCVRRATLSLAVIERRGLDALTARRAALTGVSLEQAWTSIPAFERIYDAELRRRRITRPDKRGEIDASAPGGTVLPATAGMFEDVWVFDFRSLYPSVMRTFSVDPLALARAERAPAPDDLVAPNGARFSRSGAILPAILAEYAEARAAAQAASDETAAYVYKILQNSFYGVLGAPRCRYARAELAAAITGYGRRFLLFAEAWFTARGYPVLYGDTDSVFVRAGGARGRAGEALVREGARLAAALTEELAASIAEVERVPSYLHLRCEKVYRRLFIPRIRKADGASADGEFEGERRGRGKGYAGLRADVDGEEALEIRGMEAARSDFTPLARAFQRDLLAQVFAGVTDAEIERLCRERTAALFRGRLDGALVYRKVLRRNADEYDVETPQVRAARQLGWGARRGAVEYVMTTAGAEPVTMRSGAPLDYLHYRSRQLLPIARSIAEAVGGSAERWLGDGRQLTLFRA
jgi:DNA polymerase-2